MPRLPQAPPPGVVRNATPEATPGRWWDVQNIRFRQGQILPVGGNVQFPGTQVDSPPRDVLTWVDNNNVRWAAIGTDTKLYAFQFDLQMIYDITPDGVGPLDPPGALVGFGMGDYGTSTYGTQRDPTDIGPADVAATPGDRWVMDNFGEDLLVVPTQDGSLYRWSPTAPATPAAIVPNAPTLNKGVVVTDQRQVVLYGAGNDPRMIAWSDEEDPETWVADVTNLAGNKRLVSQSHALTAIKVSQGILIFTDNGNDIHLMSFTGSPYAYGIVEIAAGCGPISPRAVVQVGSFAAWPGLQNFWMWNGNVQPMKCDVADWFFSLVNRGWAGRIFGSPNPAFSEFWWDWPDEGSTENNRYIAMNFADGNQPWTIGMRARTAGDPTGTMQFPILGGVPVDAGGALYLHEYGYLEDGQPRAANGEVYAESGAIYLGEGDNRFHVRQVILDAATPGGGDDPVFGYRFFVREQPHDIDDEYDTGLYTVAHEGLMDVRFSGRTVRMRLEALTDESFAIGRPRLEVRQGGKR